MPFGSNLSPAQTFGLTKSLLKLPHHELPYPQAPTRPRAGHIQHLDTVLLDESFEALCDVCVCRAKM